MKVGNAVYRQLGTSVFEAMSRLAAQHGAVNLGQGFPDGGEPAELLSAAAEALLHGNNQYPPMMGLPVLRQALCAHEARFYGLQLDWATETLVTSGATEALAACLLGLLEPGDEAVLLQPCYDAYAPLVRRAGATPRFVTLRAPDFPLDEGALRAAFGPRTKLVLLNNPLNPVGKVFSRAELELLARVVAEHDALVVSDEVYEHLVFGDGRHLAFPTLPGMFERTLKLGSAGKTFSLTGWKVGLVVGPRALVEVVARAHQFLTFATPPHLQAAVAHGLGLGDAYYEGLRVGMARRRDHLAAGLGALGLRTLPAEGAYFLCVDLAASGVSGLDTEVARRWVEEAGVATIPLSAFYAEEPETHLLRLCFAKAEAVLDGALARLRAYLGR